MISKSYSYHKTTKVQAHTRKNALRRELGLNMNTIYSVRKSRWSRIISKDRHLNNGIHMPMQLLVQHLRHKNEEKQFKQSKLSLLIISIFDPLRKHAHAIYRRFFTAVILTILSRFFLLFSYFCSKHRLWVHVSTHNLCFRAKIRKNVYPCKPQFYHIEVGCKGVYITRTCYPDAMS